MPMMRTFTTLSRAKPRLRNNTALSRAPMRSDLPSMDFMDAVCPSPAVLSTGRIDAPLAAGYIDGNPAGEVAEWLNAVVC